MNPQQEILLQKFNYISILISDKIFIIQIELLWNIYEGESVKRPQTEVTDVIGLCAPLGSSTVQLHESAGIRRACARSEAGFSSQNGDRA
jgi:hypothetical protein